MAQETSTKPGTNEDTFNRISAMEQKFNSLKSLYVQNMKSLVDTIMDTQKLTSVDQKQCPALLLPTNANTQEQAEQRFDDGQTLNKKIKQLATLIRKSKHFVTFTGSGISPPSERDDGPESPAAASPLSPISPVIDAWTKNLTNIGKRFDPETSSHKTKSFKDLKPTTAHMALTGLMTQEPQHLKHIISENNTPLHRQSGIDLHQLSELHDIKHTTTALDEAEKADLYLVLGSALRSSSAVLPVHMAQIVSNKWNEEINNEMDREPTHHLVIANTIETEFDHCCALRIFATVEDVMTRLMSELQLDIPYWNLTRHVKVKVSGEDVREVNVCGVDMYGSNVSCLFKNVELRYNGQNMRRVGGVDRRLSIENLFGKRGMNATKSKNGKFVFEIPRRAIPDEHDSKYDLYHAHEDAGLVAELTFMESYGVPRLTIEMNEYLSHLRNKNGCVVLKMMFDPKDEEWSVGNKREQLDDERVRKLWTNYDGDAETKNKPLPNPYELHYPVYN
eukprot:66640_1